MLMNNLKNKFVFHLNNNPINLVLHTFVLQIVLVFLSFFKYSHLETRVLLIKKLNYNKLLQIFLNK